MNVSTTPLAVPPLHPRHGPHNPTSGTPARARRSLRRTVTTDMLRPDGVLGDLFLVGRGRDLYTDRAGGSSVVAASTYEGCVAFLDKRQLTSITTTPSVVEAQKLIGVSAMTGFRAALDAALPGEGDARTLLYLLLDDLPAATLVSGYALGYAREFMLGNAREFDHRRKAPQMQFPDLCSGWRVGGSILIEKETTGISPVVTGPPAPSLARAGDPMAWHAAPPIPGHGMRRHRRLDLIHGENGLRADVLFRDSHVSPEGRETIIHEYEVTAEIDPGTRVIRSAVTTPRTLPFVECPDAAASGARLPGMTVDGLRPKVRAEFTGPSTCTHLNDTFRSLEDIVGLAPELARRIADDRA